MGFFSDMNTAYKNEINHLLEVFDTIYHIGMLHTNDAPPSTLSYISDRIHFIPIPAVGGKTILNKLNIILFEARNLYGRIYLAILKKSFILLSNLSFSNLLLNSTKVKIF